MDELLGKRLDDLERRLAAVEERTAETATSARLEQVRADLTGGRIDHARGELIDHVRQVELRLAPAVHGVLAAVQDLKTWHQERDDMRSRMQQLEARLAEVENRTSS